MDFVTPIKALGELYTTWRAKEQDRRTVLRSLYIEAQHNLAVLNYLQLDGDISVAEPGFLKAARLLRVKAHKAILFALEEHEESALEAERQHDEVEKKAHRLRLERWVPVTFIDADGLPTIEDAAEDDSVREQLRRLRETRQVGILPAAAYVASRLQAMRTMASCGDEVRTVCKKIRGGIRLRTVRAYERAIVRALELEIDELALPAPKQPVPGPSSA